jgi:hypothetical protein
MITESVTKKSENDKKKKITLIHLRGTYFVSNRCYQCLDSQKRVEK